MCSLKPLIDNAHRVNNGSGDLLEGSRFDVVKLRPIGERVGEVHQRTVVYCRLKKKKQCQTELNFYFLCHIIHFFLHQKQKASMSEFYTKTNK